MTHVQVPNLPTRVQYPVGVTPTTGPFTFGFSYFTAADVAIFNGTTLLTAGVDYTLTGNPGTVGGFEGGSFTLTAPVSNTTLTALRAVPAGRVTDFPNAGPFDIAALNLQLDTLTAVIQQILTRLSLGLRTSETDTPTNDIPSLAARANKFLAFDANGHPVVFDIALLGSVALPLSIAEGGTGATDAAAARAALGAQAALGFTPEDAALAHAYLDVVQAFTRAQRYSPVVLTDGATIDWNLDTAPLARVTLAGNRTVAAPTNQRDGGMFVLIVQQDSGGNRTLAWNAAFDFGTEGTPVLPTGSNKVAIFTFLSNGTSMRCIGRWNN